MKITKLTYGMMVATMFSLASCDINDYPEFSDSDAFVAFTSGTVTAEEGGESVNISVLLTSLSGISTSVEVQVIDSTAIEGKDFTIPNKTLTFTKENPEQVITVNIANDDEYTGSRAFTLVLKESDVKLGAAKKCTITIADDEHPLLFLFNTYTASISDYWGDEYVLEGNITRDPDDDTKVWFNDFFTPWLTQANGFHTSFYGIVNPEKTEILIPAGQSTGVSSGGNPIVLYVGESDDFSNMYDSGKNLTIQIQDEGASLLVVNSWGASNGSSWYDLIAGGVTLTKKE